MPYMVIFRHAEGRAGYHQAESLDDGVRFVEHLRNQENVSDARIFRMQEVAIEFKTYYKVEVQGTRDDAGETPAPAADLPVGETVPDAPVPGDDMVGSGTRFGRVARR